MPVLRTTTIRRFHSRWEDVRGHGPARSLGPSERSAEMGCQRMEKRMPMLKMCTVLPAIHIMKPIMKKLLKGACAISQARCAWRR